MKEENYSPLYNGTGGKKRMKELNYAGNDIEYFSRTLPLNGGFIRMSAIAGDYMEILGELVFNKNKLRKVYAVKLITAERGGLVACSEMTTAEGTLVGWNCMHSFAYSAGQIINPFVQSLGSYVFHGDEDEGENILTAFLSYLAFCEKEFILSTFARMSGFVLHGRQDAQLLVVKADKLIYKSLGKKHELMAEMNGKKERICLLSGEESPKLVQALALRLTESKLFFHNAKKLVRKMSEVTLI